MLPPTVGTWQGYNWGAVFYLGAADAFAGIAQGVYDVVLLIFKDRQDAVSQGVALVGIQG
jgi:hypothetical protein